ARLRSAGISRLALLPQNPRTCTSRKITSPGGTCMGSPPIAPNDTSTPPWPSRPHRSALARPPTESTAARAPSAPRRSRAASRQPSDCVHSTSSTPSAASPATPASRRTRLSTRTPRAAASIARVLPTAPLAAFCTIHWPGPTASDSSSISALSGIATSCAASSSGMASGTGTSARASATKYSAQVPRADAAVTRCPGAKPSTPSPIASTTPQPSLPPIAGSVGFHPYCPRMVNRSWLWIGASRMRTRTSPLPGSGTGLSPGARTSAGSPKRAWIALRIRCSRLDRSATLAQHAPRCEFHESTPRARRPCDDFPFPVHGYTGMPDWQQAIAAAWPLLAALLLGLVVRQLLLSVARRADRHAASRTSARVVRVIVVPAALALPLLFLMQAVSATPLPPSAVAQAQHWLGIGVLLCVVWLAVRVVAALEARILREHPVDVEDNLAARRIQTQARVIARVA